MVEPERETAVMNYEDKTYWRGWRTGALVALVMVAVVLLFDPLHVLCIG